MCKEVSVNIDGLETRIVFVDHQHGEISVELQHYCISISFVSILLGREPIINVLS